jgi:hypothetical protein
MKHFSPLFDVTPKNFEGCETLADERLVRQELQRKQEEALAESNHRLETWNRTWSFLGWFF